MTTDPAADGWKPRELPGFIGLVGPLWTRRERAGWAYAVVAEARHANPAGVVHGGMLTTLVDHALSAIAWEAVGRRACVTVQFDARFLAPARPGDLLEAHGRVVRASSSLVFAEGELMVKGETILTASALLKVLGEA